MTAATPTPIDPSKIVVYCDESRHTPGPQNPYWAIGSLWLPRARQQAWTAQIRALLAAHHLRGEVKWSKTSQVALPGYQALVEAFAADPDIRFRAIVVDHRIFDAQRFHGGDRELGFYKFYYEMLVKWIEPQQRYLFLLDHQTVSEADRFARLRQVLDRAVRGQAWVDDLTVVDSGETPLVQLADLLTGAVSAAWCGGLKPGSPKAALVAAVERAVGHPLTQASPGPGLEKLNIFQIRLES
jgi:hypothetical protein